MLIASLFFLQFKNCNHTEYLSCLKVTSDDYIYRYINRLRTVRREIYFTIIPD